MGTQHYNEIIDNLHLEIVHQYDSVKKFCEEFGHCRFNLSKVFTKKQDLSVGLFLKICCDLQKIDARNRVDRNYNLSLKDYLKINHSEVLFAIMNIHSS